MNSNHEIFQLNNERKSRHSNQSLWGLGVLVLGFLLLLPLLTLSGAALYYTKSERIFPGVRSGAVVLDNLKVSDAARQLDLFWNQSPHFVLSAAGETWSLSPASLGLWIDAGATAQKAFQVGRGEGGLADLRHLLQKEQIEVEPLVTFNNLLASDVLTQISFNLSSPAQEARLIQGQDMRWFATEARAGTALDVQGALAQISTDPQAALRRGYLQLETIAIPAEGGNWSEELARIDKFYEIPLKMFAYDAITDEIISWEVPQQLVAGWVRLDDPQGQPYLQVDPDQFQNYLNEWQAGIGNREIESMQALESLSEKWQNEEAFELLLRHRTSTYTVQAGDNLVGIGFKVGLPYWKIQEANPGTSIIGVGPGQVLTIPSPNEMLPYPVVRNKRIVISISQQHMWVYENWELRSEHVISTGMDKSPTLAGIFQIQTHELNAYASIWDLWMPNFMGIYEAVPGFMNGIHGLPLLSSGQRLWGNVLGSKASYGCIIMDLPAAEDLYQWAENGVVVQIQP